MGTQLLDDRMPQVEVLAVEVKRINEFSEQLSPQIEEQFEKIVEALKINIDNINRCTRDKRDKYGE